MGGSHQPDQGTGWGVVRNLHQSLSYYDIMSRLPLIKASSHIGDVRREGYAAGREELLHNNIANASKTILPGLGHIPQIEDPEAFIDSLLAFLQPQT